MCGIAGIIDLSQGRELLESCARKMSDAIYHRGPDAGDVWSSSTSPLALAHRRLSIIDLSPLGAQPMLSDCGKNAIVYNGEIYNFRTIKLELEAAGQVFKGHSDTEVLLRAIELYGFETAIEKVKGMFAIAYWQEETATLKLARDRIGEKPLYFACIEQRFVFGSELSAIFEAHPAKSLSLDFSAIASFLRYGYISAPQTVFSEIAKLGPGEIATLKLGNWRDRGGSARDFLHIESYWDVASHARSSSNPSAANYFSDHDHHRALKDFNQLFSSTVESQSVADVSLGAFLSGGIDSSIVAAVLQHQSDSPVDTFTIGFHDKSFNEAEHAAKVAKHIGSSHNELYLGEKDILEVVPNLPDMYDEPFADASQIPMFLVSRFARSKLTVCLSGDGGDELFAGYNRYFEGRRFAELAQRTPSLVQKCAQQSIGRLSAQSLDSLYATLNALLRRKGGANFGVKVHKALAALGIRNPFDLYQYLCSYHQSPEELFCAPVRSSLLPEIQPFDQDFLRAAMAWDQQWYLPGDNLVKTDRASMAVSLEMRVPLLDRDLIEFAWRVPNDMKYRDGKSKWLLRQLLYQYVPEKLIERPKMGFSVPISNWIRNELREWSSSLLAPERLQEQGIFDPLKISSLYNEHLSGKFDHGNRLWTLLMFQAWHQRYID